MYEVMSTSDARLIAIRVSGKIDTNDYRQFRSLLEDRVKLHENVRLLVLMDDFSGWESLSAAWEDLKIDVKFNKQIEKIAMVGDKTWEKIITQASRPFFHAEMRYFDHTAAEQAWEWISEDT